MQNASETSDDLFQVIPGYREAVLKEDADRERAFCEDAPELICGVCVRAFTFTHLLRLRAIHSPFILGGNPAEKDVLTFLWCVSFEYQAAIAVRDFVGALFPKAGRWLFSRLQRRYGRNLPRKLTLEQWVEGIQEYTISAFQDGPRNRGGVMFNASFYSGPTALIHAICPVINCSPKDLMAMPVKQIFQHQRAIKLANNPKAILWNPSDKVRGDWLDSLNNGRGN